MSECCASIVPVFAGLDEESLHRISDIAQHKSIKKGEFLNAPGRNKGLFILTKGMVKVYSLTEDGTERLFRIVEPGDFIGMESLFDLPVESFSEALTDLSVCAINKGDFFMLLSEYPSISIRLLKEYTKLQAALEKQLIQYTGDNAKTRVMNYLCRLDVEQNASGEDNLRKVTLPMIHKELASFLGLAPETLSRTFKAMEKEGTIRKVKNRVYEIKIEEKICPCTRGSC